MANWKSSLLKPIGLWTRRAVKKMAARAISDQVGLFNHLLAEGKNTAFGRDHDFDQIQSIEDYQSKVPIRDYEGIKDYIERIKQGEHHVLWPGLPIYFAKTSGTSSGVKYIPITKASLPYHFGIARKASMNFAAQINDFEHFDGKLIFLSGSPETSKIGSIKVGRLSGIVNHHIPALFKQNQLPSYATNCIEDWDTKLEKIMDECIGQDLRLISGIPPWVQMFAERVLQRTGKKNMKEVFPNLKILVSGGVNFEPYKIHFDRLFGADLPRLDTYPASEGFIGFQYEPHDPALILNTNGGIFYEFVTLAEIAKSNPHRISLSQVQTGVTYAVLLTTNAGLWTYNIGDTIEFVSTSPYRFHINGRVSQFISAFGEHVIEKEVQTALIQTCARHHCNFLEFTVAPQVNPAAGTKPYHEWFVEFEKAPDRMPVFLQDLDKSMQDQNIYYKDLIDGGILSPLILHKVQSQGFREYMRNQGKLGGQHKISHIRNDRLLADGLEMLLDD